MASSAEQPTSSESATKEVELGSSPMDELMFSEEVPDRPLSERRLVEIFAGDPSRGGGHVSLGRELEELQKGAIS